MSAIWKSHDESVILHHGDCLDVLETLEENSIDTVVTDPPYGIGFMGRKWDHGVPGVDYWKAVLRVIKPGSTLLAFGGTRTYHRLACAIEDAGFLLKDVIMYLFSSGFPKSHNISKAIDRKLGGKREVVGSKPYSDIRNNSYAKASTGQDQDGIDYQITVSCSEEGKLWEGYGSALKPSYEPVILAMAPLEGTFADNALKHGVAGLNIDGCRIEYEKDEVDFSSRQRQQADPKEKGWSGHVALPGTDIQMFKEKGRWPPNVVLSHHPECKVIGKKKVKGRSINRFDDGMKPFGNGAGHEYTSEQYKDEIVDVYKCHPECPAYLLDQQSGESTCKEGGLAGWQKGGYVGGKYKPIPRTGYNDSGGASRFFFTSKTSRKERTVDGSVTCKHPTVKPVDLMRWLVRLTKTPTGGVVLDPFMGSGSTGLACISEGRPFIGIELEEESFNTSIKRIKAWGTVPDEESKEEEEESDSRQGSLF